MRSEAYKQMRERFVTVAKAQRKPILGHFELTARCNLDCKMCYVHNQDNAAALKKELTTEQWKRIFDEAYECEMLYATLSGGECLLRKDFKELYLHLWNKKIWITVMSNGTLLNEDYVEFFKTYPPEMIQISLYGKDEDGYLNVTGHKGYAKTMAAITALEKAGLDVRVAVTPSKYMKDDYIDILRKCKSEKLPVKMANIMLIPNRDDPEKDDYHLSSEEAFELSKQRMELYTTLAPLADTPEPFGCMCDTPPKGLTCNAGNCLATVTAEGMMYPCASAMVGGVSLLEMSYAEAWEATKRAVDRVVQAVECIGCAYENTCPKCPTFRFKDMYSGHCNIAVCEMTRRLVAAGVKKLKQTETICE